MRVTSLTSCIPCTDSAFTGRLGDGLFCEIAEGEQYFLRLVFLFAVQSGESGAKSFDAEIVGATCTFHAVEEGRQVHQFVPGVEEVEIENLLPCHNLLMKYKTISRNGNHQKTSAGMLQASRRTQP